MKDLLLKKASVNQEAVKVEERPLNTFTLSELVKETGLSTSECGCLVDQLITDGSVERVTYVTGSTVCGAVMTSTVYKQKVTSTKKEAIIAKK